MRNVKIETLTPVHIGSGRELMKNTEFLNFNRNDEPVLVVIDEQKVLNIIGSDNIDKWVTIIQNRTDLKAYLQQRKTNLKISDVKKRSMVVYSDNFTQNQTIKEQLFDGRQISYIPGSSLKGAIRTAVVSQKALQNKALASRSLKNFKGKFDSSELERKLFGGNPNEDVFRFLHVGDAFFDYETVALKAEIYNMHSSGWSFKNGGGQLIESIPNGADSSFRIKFDTELLAKNNSKFETDFLSEKQLFKVINAHTLSLIDNELKFWPGEKIKDIAINDIYIAKLTELRETILNCNENEAVLRVGFGSGWSFITGGWSTKQDIMDDNEYESFLYAVRNQKKYDENVPFPKSRKIADEGDIFGFVKLTIEE